ncbi:T7SS effector LXG polymorphic toxin [Pueribacillus sp. YX66]|uniref:T7SS effector LXG polymorphic toxin n=1 Tax=Pueribacillus sp. YX66 TaxID=3229242 RepID=UPI00358D9FEB
MSINMFLPEVQQQTESVEKLCQSYISGMEEVKKSIAAFSMEFRLKGKTYDSAKTYFAKTYLPLAEGIILLSEAVIRAHQQLPERYITEVDRACNQMYWKIKF